MAKRVDVSRLSRHQLFYIAGFKRGLKTALAEARQLFREEMTATVKELVELKVSNALLASKYHRLLIDRAIETAQAERQSEENRFRPLH